MFIEQKSIAVLDWFSLETLF